MSRRAGENRFRALLRLPAFGSVHPVATRLWLPGRSHLALAPNLFEKRHNRPCCRVAICNRAPPNRMTIADAARRIEGCPSRGGRLVNHRGFSEPRLHAVEALRGRAPSVQDNRWKRGMIASVGAIARMDARLRHLDMAITEIR